MIIYYDGVCVFCSKWVRLVIKHDKHERFMFCPIQSEKADHIREHGLVAEDDVDSIVLETGDGRYLLKSTASLTVFRYLAYPAKILAAGLIVPRPIRDYVYDFIGRRRYRIFGKLDACPIPDPEIRSRFLS